MNNILFQIFQLKNNFKAKTSLSPSTDNASVDQSTSIDRSNNILWTICRNKVSGPSQKRWWPESQLRKCWYILRRLGAPRWSWLSENRRPCPRVHLQGISCLLWLSQFWCFSLLQNHKMCTPCKAGRRSGVSEFWETFDDYSSQSYVCVGRKCLMLMRVEGSQIDKWLEFS